MVLNPTAFTERAIVSVMSSLYQALALALALSALGCSQSHRVGEPDDADAGGLPDAGDWEDGGPWWPDAALPDVGPACFDAGGAVEIRNCDLIEQDCESGLACYGWVEYTDDPCQREIYHSDCLEPGLGGQGESCELWCLAGFECFVTGVGTQCLRICDIVGGRRSCPPGLICGPTDHPGIGACQ